jgi:hypothetical protein
MLSPAASAVNTFIIARSTIGSRIVENAVDTVNKRPSRICGLVNIVNPS